MSYGFLEIDHVLCAANPSEGREQYERLGFNLTPISIIESMGIGNRLILFPALTPGAANFIELMGVVDPWRVAAGPMADILSGPPGVRSMVLCSPDAQYSYETLSRDGYPFAPPLDIEREWRLPEGEVLRPSFRVALPIAAPLQFNFCQYRTLHYYLRPEWLEHSNGALHLTRVFALSAEPGVVASYYERVFSTRARVTQGLQELGPGRCLLTIGDRRSLAALLPQRWLPEQRGSATYIGFEVRVRSLAGLRQTLRDRGVVFAEHDGALVVAPSDACGNVLRFVQLEG